MEKKDLEFILSVLADKSVKSKTHKERKDADKTAYCVIREVYENKKIVKFWDDYYQTAKRII